MSYAVRIGSISRHWIDNDPTPDGHVRFDGQWPQHPVWDDVLQNVRAENAAEHLARVKASAIETNRTAAAARIGAKWPTWRQMNLADGTYPDTEPLRAQMVADKQAVIGAENTAADAIEACTTVEQVAAVVVNWPVI